MVQKSKAILILGLFDTSIMTARCLKGLRLKMYGLDYKPELLGFSSNLIKSSLIPNPNQDKVLCIKFIINWLSEHQHDFIIIPTSDEFVKLCSDYRTELSPYATFLLPDTKSVDRIIERDLQFQDAQAGGIRVPTFLAGNVSINDILKANIKFPIAIKPINTVEWKRVLDNKGYVINNLEELEKIILFLNNKKVRYIAQEIIEGDNINNYEVNTIYFPDGKYFQHSIRKIRQYPNRFGTATCIEYFSNPEIEAQAIAYIKKYNLYGFTNIEFKYAAEDQAYYFIETNPRVWLQVNFSKQLGINFPLLYYKYLIGEAIPEAKTIVKGGKWVDFLPDLLFWKKHHSDYGYSLFAFIKTWTPIVSTSLLSFSDPMPFLKDIKPIKRLKTLLKP